MGTFEGGRRGTYVQTTKAVGPWNRERGGAVQRPSLMNSDLMRWRFISEGKEREREREEERVSE